MPDDELLDEVEEEEEAILLRCRPTEGTEVSAAETQHPSYTADAISTTLT